jgi:Mg-chelatase subunit ChlD
MTDSKPDTKLYVHVLLDRSGSMEDCRDSTIGAFNEYVNGLKHSHPAAARLSLTTFDSNSIDTMVEAMRIAEVPKLTRETFVPRGGTPLFDAIGAVVASIDKVTLVPDERVALAILTDGHENASREYRAETVKKLLADRQQSKNWLVLYLGANQDAWAVGATMGLAAAHCMSYDIKLVGNVMSVASASVQRFAAAPAAKAREAASFTPAERAKSKMP